jgi:uncharacterized protein YqgC (DUF456 family)
MNTVTRVKLGVVLIALIIWAYGFRTDDRTLMWVGMALVVVAFLLRFVPQRRE